MFWNKNMQLSGVGSAASHSHDGKYRKEIKADGLLVRIVCPKETLLVSIFICLSLRKTELNCERSQRWELVGRR